MSESRDFGCAPYGTREIVELAEKAQAEHDRLHERWPGSYDEGWPAAWQILDDCLGEDGSEYVAALSPRTVKALIEVADAASRLVYDMTVRFDDGVGEIRAALERLPAHPEGCAT